MTIIFTICSNNYLPMARLLGASLLRFNPDVHFAIGLVDVPSSEIDPCTLEPFEVIPIDQIGIPHFETMVLNYSIVELNTAVKPFLFRHLFQRARQDESLKVIYLDPDVAVYAPLTDILQSLDRSAILLTPHILTPIPVDNKFPPENEFLNFGLYNLGFCAMRNCAAARELVDWWAERLATNCRIDVANGVFVDQLWINFAPLFFRDVEISRNPGLNMAYWNLHERHLSAKDGTWYVNQTSPLIFFHFSNFPIDNSDAISRVDSRFTLNDRPDLRPLFDDYRSRLLALEYHRLRNIPCVYIQRREQWLLRQKRAYYRSHPIRYILSVAKKCVPRPVKAFLRSS